MGTGTDLHPQAAQSAQRSEARREPLESNVACSVADESSTARRHEQDGRIKGWCSEDAIIAGRGAETSEATKGSWSEPEGILLKEDILDLDSSGSLSSSLAGSGEANHLPG
jgi:hypothetical protein